MTWKYSFDHNDKLFLFLEQERMEEELVFFQSSIFSAENNRVEMYLQQKKPTQPQFYGTLYFFVNITPLGP